MANKSIVSRILLGSATLIVCAIVLSLMAIYWQVSTQSEVSYKAQHARQFALLQKSLESPLWTLDEQTIKLVCDTFLVGNDVVSVEVVSPHQNKPLYYEINSIESDANYRAADISYGNEIIGSVKVGFSDSSHGATLSLLMVYSLVIALFLALVFILVNKILIKRYLDMPLSHLGDWTDRIAFGDHSALPMSNDIVELGPLIDKFSNMATKVQQREISLSESEERFRSIFESAAAAMVIISPDGSLLQVNQAACEFFGYSVEEFRNLKVDNLSHPSDANTNRDRFEELRSGRCSSLEYENRYRYKDGSVIWGRSTMAAVRNAGGEILHIVALTQNITDQKHAEAELVKHKNQLEVLVDEKTIELRNAQDELIKKERLATLGRLTTTVSHELRNPLGTIQNSLYNIRNSINAGKPEFVKKALEIGERNAIRCDRIIDELLNFGKKSDLYLKLVDIDALIEETLDEMEQPEGIDLESELKSNASVSGDTEKLRRVIFNLVLNAQQALQESSGKEKRVFVKTRMTDDEVEILIKDNGPGVPADLQEKIFEPLFSTKNFGVGLGMTIVKDIISEHKGRVELQTEAEQGCQFIVRLPLSQ